MFDTTSHDLSYVQKVTLTVAEHTQQLALRTVLIIVFVSVISARLLRQLLKTSPFPLVNGKRTLEFSSVRCKKEFMGGAWPILSKRMKDHPDQPFRVVADVGEVTILPPKYAYELRNHDDMSFTQAAFKWYYAHLPGFEGFREGTNESHIMKLVARHQLTHQLMLVTQPVSDECAAALKDIYGDSTDWQEMPVKAANLQLMARITSRIFLGEELCRNKDWLRITSTYTVVVFGAVEELRLWPAWARSTVQWFLPRCTAARKLVREAHELIAPLLKSRQLEKEALRAEGKSKVYNDAIEWLETMAQEKGLNYDAASSQLSLSVAALHSTTDFFTQAVIDIANHPEILTALRQEIVDVLDQGGWTKHSLYNLKLMDSALKESQRLKPIAIASMRRYTTADVKLSDGIVLPKDCLTLVSAHRQWDSDVYEKPNDWDGYRFLRMRQSPGKENTSQLVSVSPEHMGFGYGLHACPGRFFASEEIKIALCHIIMNYDIKPIPNESTAPRRYGLNMMANPTAKLAFRRREPEIKL